MTLVKRLHFHQWPRSRQSEEFFEKVESFSEQISRRLDLRPFEEEKEEGVIKLHCHLDERKERKER